MSRCPESLIQLEQAFRAADVDSFRAYLAEGRGNANPHAILYPPVKLWLTDQWQCVKRVLPFGEAVVRDISVEDFLMRARVIDRETLIELSDSEHLTSCDYLRYCIARTIIDRVPEIVSIDPLVGLPLLRRRDMNQQLYHSITKCIRNTVWHEAVSSKYLGQGLEDVKVVLSFVGYASENTQSVAKLLSYSPVRTECLYFKGIFLLLENKEFNTLVSRSIRAAIREQRSEVS